MRHLKLVSSESPMTTRQALRLAFASSDRKTVNQHFGAAKAFAIYEIHARGFQLAEVVEFAGQSTAQDGQEDKLAAKIQLLDSCVAVYCNAVGASAIRQLLAVGIQPLKVEAHQEIETLLKELQEAWVLDPPIWLQRSLRQQQLPAAEQRFAAMARKGWGEEEWQS